MKSSGRLTINPNVQLLNIQFPFDMKSSGQLPINPNVQFFNIQFPFDMKSLGRLPINPNVQFLNLRFPSNIKFIGVRGAECGVREGGGLMAAEFLWGLCAGGTINLLTPMYSFLT